MQDIMNVENYIKAVNMLSDLSNKIDESFKNTNENILESSKKFLSFLRDSKKPEAASIIPPLVSAAASLTGNPLIEKAVDMVIDNSVYFSDMADIAPPQIPVKKSIIDHENDILKQLFREVYAKLMSMGSDSPDIHNILELMYNTLNKKIA
jgi:hypothetical protein